MAAYGSGSREIKRAHIQRAARDTEDVQHGRPRWLTIATSLAGLIALTSAGLLYAYG
jgi:hypothetical protein